MGAENPELKSADNDEEDQNNDLALLCTSNVSVVINEIFYQCFISIEIFVFFLSDYNFWMGVFDE